MDDGSAQGPVTQGHGRTETPQGPVRPRVRLHLTDHIQGVTHDLCICLQQSDATLKLGCCAWAQPQAGEATGSGGRGGEGRKGPTNAQGMDRVDWRVTRTPWAWESGAYISHISTSDIRGQEEWNGTRGGGGGGTTVLATHRRPEGPDTWLFGPEGYKGLGNGQGSARPRTWTKRHASPRNTAP